MAKHSYGASNQRLLSEENGLRTWFAWGGGATLAEYGETAGSLSWTRSYVYLGGRLLGSEVPTGVSYHHADRLGTRLTTNTASGQQSEQAHLPFGQALAAESSGVATNRRFTSYDRSGTTQLDYAVNRFYAAGLGRFTQVDPIEMSAANLVNPQSLNLYAYVQNDPVNFTDPTGLNPQQVIINNGTINIIGILNGLLSGGASTASGNLNPLLQDIADNAVIGGGGGEEKQDVQQVAVQQSQQPQTDCLRFVNAIVGIVEPRASNFFAAISIGKAFAKATVEQARGGKTAVTGFRTELTANGQDSDVYRHVYGGAASVLGEGGNAAGFQDDSGLVAQILSHCLEQLVSPRA
jgi:RHS repeat-associated protein